MKNAYLAFAALSLLLGVGCGAPVRTNAPASNESANQPAQAQPASMPDPVPSPTPDPTPAPKPTEPPTAGMNVKTYAAADVAAHKDATSCWTIINESVYDVTAWIARHPGGSDAILSLCGKDGSSIFNGQHGGAALQENRLASFKIGALKK